MIVEEDGLETIICVIRYVFISKLLQGMSGNFQNEIDTCPRMMYFNQLERPVLSGKYRIYEHKSDFGDQKRVTVFQFMSSSLKILESV